MGKKIYELIEKLDNFLQKGKTIYYLEDSETYEIFTIFGFWTKIGERPNIRRLILVVLTMLIEVIICATHIIYCLNTGKCKVENILISTELLIAILLLIFTHFMITYYQTEAKILYDKCFNNTVFPRPVFLSKLKRTFTFFAFNIWILGSLIFFLIKLYISEMTKDCPEKTESTCAFITPMILPTTTYPKLTRLIFGTLQIISAVLNFLLAIEMISFIYICNEYAILQIKFFKDKINELGGINIKLRKKYTRDCLKLHWIVIRELEHYFHLSESGIMALALGTGVIIGLLSYNLSKEFSYMQLSLNLLVICGIYLLSHSSQKLIDESSELKYTLYSSIEWDGDVEHQKNILFMMMNCNKSLALRGFILVLSHETLISLAKFCMSLINLFKSKS